MIAFPHHVGSSSPMLLPQRDVPYCLHDVFEKIVDSCRDEIILDFGDCHLRFKVDVDTDTIDWQFQGKVFAVKRGYRRIGSEAPWRQYLDQNCGWTWLAINQQGFWDTALLSFDSAIPNILVCAMASSLYIYTVNPMHKTRSGKGAKSKNNKNDAQPKSN